jgi:hypothetical protein
MSDDNLGAWEHQIVQVTLASVRTG